MINAPRDNTERDRIRLGMVGGGQGAFIGGVHRLAARMDDQYVLVAGALSSDRERALASARQIGLARDRSYGTYQEMAATEVRRPDGIEAVAIVTPNHLHAPIAKTFLDAGIHVICEKPLTTTVTLARELVLAARHSGKVFAVAHNYTGYPMVRQAREMVVAGSLGTLRLVEVEHIQDWLTKRLETTGNKQAKWRTDPEQSGAGGALGDIGTHAYNLAVFVSGLVLDSLLADVTTFAKGRKVDDNAHVLLRYDRGARGTIWVSQVAPGHENALRLRLYGTKGGIEWAQEEPNQLWFAPFGRPKRLLTRSGAGVGSAAGRVTRVPSGHPEGYLESFANIYSEIARAIRAARRGRKANSAVIYPSVEDGLAGVVFVDACLRSSMSGSAWVKVPNLSDLSETATSMHNK